MKLIQKHILWGTQEFEVIDDTVVIRTKAPFKAEEELTVMLTVLNSEPLINKSRLEFTSRVNNEALLSLYLAKPNATEFNAFVSALKEKIAEEFNAFAGIKAASDEAMKGNVFEEPPEFDDDEDFLPPPSRKPVRIDDLEDSIRMLKEYIGTEQVQPLIKTLEALKEKPDSADTFNQVAREFNALGMSQGAVLTYAPYIGILMTDSAPISY